MVVKANSTMPNVIIRSPAYPICELKAQMLNEVLVLPVSHAPVDTITRPVREQTTMVSINGPNMAIKPCLTLCFVLAVA